MIIALTGTPGTGKSSVARELRRLGERVVELSSLARESRSLLRRDRRRGSWELDLSRLSRLVRERWGEAFVEGHLSHLLDVDAAVVLRCSPPVLRRRLRRRRYPEAKVRENSLAEALDAITVEAVERLGRDRVAEIDTTQRGAESVARIIARIVHGGFRAGERYRPGRVDFSADVLRNTHYYITNNSAGR